MKLSVIIAAYRRHEMTVRHVEECLKSTRVPDEIVVVNDGGDPCLRDMLPRSGNIIYARIEQDILWNVNGAWNLGVWLSTGDILAIEDTDHIPDRNLYKEGMEAFDGTIDRLPVRRKIIQIEELSKPMEEWIPRKEIGPNQMTSMMTRELYLKLKGQDERFGGNYGYLAMDWHNRYANMRETRNGKGKYYWAVFGDEGEPGMNRSMSPINRRIYRENSLRQTCQHPNGILNFTYVYEKF